MGSLVKELNNQIEGVLVTPLKTIEVVGGDVQHAMKKSDPGYVGFGEAYFSIAESGFVKGWKKHKLMTLNLVVCAGKVRFVIYDDRKNISTENLFQEVTLSSKNYSRLTIPPGVWMGFQGIETKRNMLMNIADIEHSSDEVDRLNLDDIDFNWEM